MTTKTYGDLLREAGPLDLGVRPQDGARGFGEVNYLGVGAVDEPSPAESWAQKVRSNLPGGWLAGIPKNDPAPTITDIELRMTYPEATPEELARLHDLEESRDYGFTLAEGNKYEALSEKWVKSGGNRHQEQRDGLVIDTWTRGKEQVCEVTQPDGTRESWRIPANLTLRHHVDSSGAMVRTAVNSGYQIGMRRMEESVFIDCAMADELPQRVMPLSDKVNGKKASVPASIEPSGQVCFGEVRGSIKDHQFVVKTPTGAFITLDQQGQPMLAQLDKLPDNIPLNWQDVDRHNAFAQQVEQGERSLGEVVRTKNQQELARPLASPDRATRSLKILENIDRHEKLAETPDDLEMVFSQAEKKIVQAPSR